MLDEREGNPRHRDERSLSPPNSAAAAASVDGRDRRDHEHDDMELDAHHGNNNSDAHDAAHHSHHHQDSASAAQGDQRPVIFVNNLSKKTENVELEEVYSKFGKLTKVSVMYDPHTRESRGFAFLDFETLEDALNAVKSTAGIVLHGREIKAEMAKRGRPRTPTPGRYHGVAKRPRRYDPYPAAYPPRDYYRRSPERDYRDSYRRRGPSPPPRDRYGPPSYPRDYDPYPRDPYPPRGRYASPPPPPVHYDRRSPPRGYGGSRGYDRY